MRAAPYLFPTLLAFALAPFGCGDDETGGTGGQGGQAEPCSVEADCDDGNGCTFDYCIDGFCQHPFDDGPDEEAEQISGDCMVFECNGGASTLEVDVNDRPEDPNEGDCTISICTPDGMPSTADAEDGEPCNLAGQEAVCGGGTCSCAPPSPDATVFVNPVEGTDAPTHGGARGACAYRTLDYALANANGEIRVSLQDYTSAEVTFPIVLTGNQFLNCPYDDQNQITTKLIGSGTFQTATAVVVFNGTSNGINDCEIVATGADHGVVVATPSQGERHRLEFAYIHGATSDGVHFLDGAVGFEAFGSLVAQNGGAGIHFGASAQQGYMSQNELIGNTGSDVTCGDPSPGLGGDSNNIGSCIGCDNCPF